MAKKKVIAPLITDGDRARQARCKGVHQVKETGDIDDVNAMLAHKDENWWIIDVEPRKPWFVLGRGKT